MAEITTEVMANETPDIEVETVVDGGNGVVGTIINAALTFGAMFGAVEGGIWIAKTSKKLVNKLLKKDEIIEVESYDEEDEVE